MKKLIFIFISLLLISCTNNNTQIEAVNKDMIMAAGFAELSNEKEKETVNSGLTSKMVIYRESANKKVDTNSPLYKKKIEKVVNYIYKYQDRIIASENSSDTIQKAIEYMGTSESGRKALQNSRFLFLDYINKEKFQELSKKYGFKFSSPKVDGVDLKKIKEPLLFNRHNLTN